MIKDVLVSLPVGEAPTAVVDYAVSVATAFDAHIAGLTFAYEPVVPGTVFDGFAADIIANFRAESEKLGQAAIAKFEEKARRASLSAESHMLESGPAGASELFAQIARHFDLAVLPQAGPETEGREELTIEGALFGSGRPILVVPYIQKAGLKLDRVMVCWDGSRAAARAIGDAMPFLERAKAIEIVTVAKQQEPADELPGVDISRHLARHKISVDFKRIVANDIEISSAILSYAADAGTDFVVMGGYGHSRLREFVLGGATRGILESMTVPVLMSH
ncbi:MAG: universal stress protein [Alphaproteobacteria bacterium]|nr:universal stress protein [Alphaproteobacteria bacterium]